MMAEYVLFPMVAAILVEMDFRTGLLVSKFLVVQIIIASACLMLLFTPIV